MLATFPLRVVVAYGNDYKCRLARLPYLMLNTWNPSTFFKKLDSYMIGLWFITTYYWYYEAQQCRTSCAWPINVTFSLCPYNIDRCFGISVQLMLCFQLIKVFYQDL